MSIRRGLVWRFFVIGALQLALTVVFAAMLPRLLHPLLHDSDGRWKHTRPSVVEHTSGDSPRAHSEPSFHELSAQGRPPFRRGPRRIPIVLPTLTVVWGLLMVALGAFALRRWIVLPLHELTRAADEFGSGRLQTRAEIIRADEIGDLAHAFNSMTARIEKMVRREKELLANVSHELRTPLARIRVAMELAKEGDAATTRELLHDVEQDVAELDTMLEDILAIRRLEAQSGVTSSAGFSFTPSVVTIREILEDAASRFRARYPDRTLSLQSVDATLFVDRMLLRRAFDNLLANAHQHTQKAEKPIEVRMEHADAHVRVTIVDHGDGIAPQDLDQIFEPFFRADRSRARATGGVGLGLPLTKQIVEALGGRIEVQSELGTGTQFTVTLPQVIVEGS